MSRPVENHQLADLVFEVTQTREPKFLLAVCDDGAKRRRLKRELRKALETAHKRVIFIAADELRTDLLNFFYGKGEAGNVDAVVVAGLERMGASAATGIFWNFNFHRDALVTLGIPFVIWISNE